MDKYKPRANFQDIFLKMYPEFRNTSGFSCKTITFVVTEDCTLRCSYCYQCNKNYGRKMTKETAMKAVDMILDDANRNFSAQTRCGKTRPESSSEPCDDSKAPRPCPSGSLMNGYMDSSVTKGVIIDFIGGEPLLAVDIIDFVCDYFRYKATELNHPWAKYHMFSITSNGTEYFKPEVQRFIRKNAGRLSLGITVDGHRELHDACRLYPDGSGSYTDVEKAIKHAGANYNLNSTKVTLAPENLRYINVAMPHLIENLGIRDIHANPVFEDVWEDRHAQEYYAELMKLADWFLENGRYKHAVCSLFDEHIGVPLPETETNNWCGGNGAMLAIGTDGNLYPCIRFMKYSLQNQDLPEFLIGDVEKGIEDTDKNPYIKELWSITRQSQSTEECLKCPVARGCAWCTGYNYDAFGTPDKRATFICKLHKARCLANYYYWNKLYELEGESKAFYCNLSTDDITFLTNATGMRSVNV